MASGESRPNAKARDRQSEDHFRRALEIGTVGICFYHFDGVIFEANRAFLRLMDYTREDIAAGRVRWDVLTPPEWMPRTLDAIAQLRSCGDTTPYEKEFIRKDRGAGWGLFAASRLGSDEAIEYVIDITDRKRTEAELRHARDSLELSVEQRTKELQTVASELRDQIIERQRSETERQELLRQLVTAQEEERRRISRELHDEIGQLVTALLLGLRTLPVLRRTAGPVEKLHKLAERVGREVHAIALRLRPTSLDDLGLIHALANYVEEWSQRTRIAVDFHDTGWEGERLPGHLESTIYRIVQEALTNVVKHARATRVSLILERRPDQATVIVEDNGRGFDSTEVQGAAAGARLGLLGMSERAALVHGELSIESSATGGTTVFVRIPLIRSRTL